MNKQFLILSCVSVVMLTGLNLLHAQPGSGGQALTTEQAVEEICGMLAETLKQRRQSQLNIDTPRVDRRISGATGIYKQLVTGLEKHDIHDDPDALYELSINIDLTRQAPKRLMIDVQLLDEDGEVLTISRKGSGDTPPKQFDKVEKVVDDPASVAHARGLTAELPTRLKKEQRLPNLDTQEKRKDFFHDPTEGWVMVDRFSKFAVRVIDPSGKPYGVTNKNGKPFLVIPKGAVYQLELRTTAPHETAAEITIDGLNVFVFSEVKDEKGNPAFSRYIIGKKESARIIGWFVHLKRSDAFEVTEYADSAAASLKHPKENIGVITVSFSAAWEIGADPPLDEGEKQGEGATKRGPPQTTNAKPVQRNIGKVRTIISLRYDLE